MNSASRKIPPKKALLSVLISIIFVSGPFAVLTFYNNYKNAQQKADPAYQITAIVQASNDIETLPTIYFSELLQLSIDRPINIFEFKLHDALKNIMKSPLIKSASVKKIKPGIIHIEYALRKPIAFLGDYTNTAIDSEKVAFPFKPFFTPKRLPSIYLGEDTMMTWGFPIQFDSDQNTKNCINLLCSTGAYELINNKIDLAFNILQTLAHNLKDNSLTLCEIDVSKAFAQSYGKRQIVLSFEERKENYFEGAPVTTLYNHLIRLCPDHLYQQLANYLLLRKTMAIETATEEGKAIQNSKSQIIIDLRLPHLAFISTHIGDSYD